MQNCPGKAGSPGKNGRKVGAGCPKHRPDPTSLPKKAWLLRRPIDQSATTPRNGGGQGESAQQNNRGRLGDRGATGPQQRKVEPARSSPLEGAMEEQRVAQVDSTV